MAKLTKQGPNRIWVAFRHSVNRTLSVQGFSDTIEKSLEDGTENVSESAERKLEGFRRVTPNVIIIDGALSAESAIALAKERGI